MPSGPTQTATPARRRPILRCIAITILALIVLIGLLVLIIWLTVKPKKLVYTIEDGSVHGFNLADKTLNATFDLTLRADNPNTRIAIYYDSIEVSVWYEDQIITISDVRPFFQPRRNATRLEVKAVAQSTPVLQTVYNDLRHDKSKGEVQLEVRMKARIRFKMAKVKSRHYTLKAYCYPVVHFNPSKPFERTFCDVDI
ncbi:uncharacterized protein At1g08160-like [Tasmannia lanceolata]|uniref:uncharacterized protein At1g08160-like n=1 Tax=Tasmannia lanceolata TaxID=3420 RepID=UPI004063D0E8